MATIQKNESLNYWRDFFATANNSTIFDVLDHAITLAASDFPEEFSRQRSRILGSIQGLGGGDDRRSDLGFGTASETGSEQKAEPSKPSLKVLIKIVKRNVDGSLIIPSSDEAKPIKPSSDENKSIKQETCVDKVALDRAKMIKPPPCVGEAKSIKPKPCLDEVAIEAKLLATKRKFHDRYEEIENSKKQRRIQVLNYLPNQDFKLGCPTSTKPQGKKLGNHCLQSSARRRVANKLGFQSFQSNRIVSAAH